MSTGNRTYRDAANLTNEFLYSHLYDPTTGHLCDNFKLTTCIRSSDTYTYDMGLYLEGLSVLANKTSNQALIDR